MSTALLFHHAVIIFTGQQAQRKPDAARLMAQHLLNREMRLARVGRAKDGRDAAIRLDGMICNIHPLDVPQLLDFSNNEGHKYGTFHR